MEKRGTFIKESYVNAEGITKQKIIGFKPNDLSEYNLMCTDHFYLCKKERDFDVKRNIDKFSEYNSFSILVSP